MASPFAKYQSEQVQQIAPGFVEAYGRAGASIGQGIANIGANVAQGLAEADKRRKEEIANKAALAPYIKNDERIKRAEDFAKAGIFTKAADGTLTVSADWADKVNMPEVDKVLSFYNTTGGDGSKLSGDALTEFTARFQSEQKYVSEQAGRAKAKLDLDLQQAQIDELKSKKEERLFNAGAYANAIGSILGGTPSVSSTLPSITLPDTTTSGFQSIIGGTVSKADTTVTGVAAPAAPAVPAVSAALTAGTAAAPAPTPAAPTSADFDKYGYPKQKPATEVSAPAPAKAAAAPAAPKQPEAPAVAQTPAAQAPAAAPTTPAAATTTPAPTAPAAPVTYDVPAKAAEVAEKMKAVEVKRTSVRTKFATLRVATEGEIAISSANARAVAPRNKVGLDLANSVASFNERRLKSIADAEEREIKAVDAEAEAIKSEFTNYQAAATAARQGRTEDRLSQQAALENKKAEVAAAKAADDKTIDLVQGYPTIGIWTAVGSQMTDPKTGKRVDPALVAGIPRIGDAQRNNIIETNVGYGAAQGFLLKMDDILRDRNASDNDIRDRFRLTASNMKGYFEAELASVFGVATFRKAIVSGGNFSDADREFVKSAITYLNTAAPDMSAEDLKASVNALSGFINAMYQRQMEYNGMRYAPDVAAKQAVSLRNYGDASGADAIDTQSKRAAEFYNRFNIKIGSKSSYSPEFSQAVSSARSTLWNAMKKGGVDTSKFDDSAPNRVK